MSAERLEVWFVETGEAIGRRIAHTRKLRGLTQIGLAGRAHVSKSLVANNSHHSGRGITPWPAKP